MSLETNEEKLKKLLNKLKFKPDTHSENANNSFLLIYYLNIETVFSDNFLLNIEFYRNDWHLNYILNKKHSKQGKTISKEVFVFFSRLKKENQERIINSIEKYILENS